MTALRDRVTDLGLTGRDFLTIHDFAPAEIGALLDLAVELKAAHKRGRGASAAHQPVGRHDLHQDLDAHAHLVRGRHRPARRPAALPQRQRHPAPRRRDHQRHRPTCCRRYLDAIMIRTFAQARRGRPGARAATIPVINGLTDDHHPCQAHGRRAHHQGALRRPRRARTLVYSGDGNNVAHSLAEVGAKTGMHVVVCTPDDYRPDEAIIARARADAAADRRDRSSSPATCAPAVRGADVIYTDTFTSMGQEAEHDVRLAALRDYQVNDELLALAGPQVRVMHCLPAHWGEEITEAAALRSPSSVVFDQAENRLHAQKAIMAALIG